MKLYLFQVVAECTLKESAAINQILGRKVKKLKILETKTDKNKIRKSFYKDLNIFFQWHALTREEQAKYYEQVRIK